MLKGTVKTFDVSKGYGFITPDEEGVKDVFVHFTQIEGKGFKTLSAGDRVVYEIKETDRGSQAQNVVKVD